MSRVNQRIGIAVFLSLLFSQQLLADDKPSIERKESPRRQTEETMFGKTLGGMQFWGDVHNFRGWRIQQNVFTKHYRLIDPDDVRHAYGSQEDCLKILTSIREKRKLEPPTGPAVILIHGLMRSSKCMATMQAKFNEEGYSTLVFDYPKRRAISIR
jgi:hypothetical protein